MGGFDKTAVLWRWERATLPLSQPQGLSETQGFMDPGVSVGPEASRSPLNILTSQLALS